MASQMPDASAAARLLDGIVSNVSETIRMTLLHLNYTLATVE
jgi:hypothetical protein|eukprot:COSAG02_NODE_2589_length_8471_cov_113.759556_4_plen_42_part_00